MPVCTTEQGIEIIKKQVLIELANWKNILRFNSFKFKKNNILKKSGVAGLFSASLELGERRIN